MKKQQNFQRFHKKGRELLHMLDYTQSQRLKTESSTYIHTHKERVASLKKIHYCEHEQGASATTDYYKTIKMTESVGFKLAGDSHGCDMHPF